MKVSSYRQRSFSHIENQIFSHSLLLWAVPGNNALNINADKECPDQHAHLHSLIRVFVKSFQNHLNL